MAIITPAITVLSAAEGFTAGVIRASTAGSCRLPAVVILAGLFAFQYKRHQVHRRASSDRSMLLWFTVLGLLGLWHVWQAPFVLKALNPLMGINLLLNHTREATVLLGSVVSVPSPAPKRSSPTWVTSAARPSRGPGIFSRSPVCC
jgi:KUP system potassium uptake protein